MQQETAEAIALKAVAWLIANEEVCPLFLGSTGMSEGELRERIAETEFLSAVLDFLTMNDEWVKDCAQSTELDPFDFMRARQALPGGGDVHWT